MVESRRGGNKREEKGKMYTRELDRLKMREDGMCKLRHWETEIY